MFLFLFPGACLAVLSRAGAPRGSRLLPARPGASVASTSRCAEPLVYSPVQGLTVCLPSPAGCPRERQWEAVELASAAGEAGLPLSLC